MILSQIIKEHNGFMQSLACAWKTGEVRPTHKVNNISLFKQICG